MQRRIEPEILDRLPPDDPQAIGSRRDLRRINAWMGNARLTAACLASLARSAPPQRIVDLGTGDGAFLLRLIHALPALPCGIETVLVDRSNAADSRLLEGIRDRGFKPRVDQADVFDWLSAAPAIPGTWMVANLFLHHFTAGQLRAMFELVARKAIVFCACEPRRAGLALAAARLVCLIGANAVTRHDAVVSVRAGFDGEELSALWPPDSGWSLHEHAGGLASHVFLGQVPAAV